MEILNLSEDTEILNIKEISPKEIEKYNYHILHSGKINKQILNYLIYNTKISFEEIRKLFTFDFSKAEKEETIVVINEIAMRR